jgi:hypothetical protein
MAQENVLITPPSNNYIMSSISFLDLWRQMFASRQGTVSRVAGSLDILLVTLAYICIAWNINPSYLHIKLNGKHKTQLYALTFLYAYLSMIRFTTASWSLLLFMYTYHGDIYTHFPYLDRVNHNYYSKTSPSLYIISLYKSDTNFDVCVSFGS